MDGEYATLNRIRLKNFPINDGIADSMRELLLNKDPYDSMLIILL